MAGSSCQIYAIADLCCWCLRYFVPGRDCLGFTWDQWDGQRAGRWVKFGGKRTRSALILFILCALFGLSPSAVSSAELPDPKQARTVHVRLQHNILVPSNQGPVHAVSFNYSFPERDSIYISGLGRVSSSGSFSYLTVESQITFSDEANGVPVEILDLEDATRLMGKTTVNLPDTSDFPEAFRIGFWRHTASFPEHATSVFSEQFRSGFMTMVFEDVNTFKTTYRPLSGLPDTLFGEVAVLLSHGQRKNEDTFSFRIHFKARERRTHTRWRDQVSDDTLRAAEAFIDYLFTALQGGT